MKATRKLKGRRRRWYELYEETKRYVERKARRGMNSLGKMGWSLWRLPKGFICFHYRRDVPIEDRVHQGIVLALHRPVGALEYDMPLDRAILRRIQRVWDLSH